MNIIRFIRLLFYHIYVYFDRTEKQNVTITKYSTFLVLTVLFILLSYSIFNLAYQLLDENYIGISAKSFVFICLIIGISIAYYTYKEDFNDFDKFKDYHPKYYFYFFTMVLAMICLLFYSSFVTRQRKEHRKEAFSINLSKKYSVITSELAIKACSIEESV